MRWVNSQLGRVLGWVERAVQQEVKFKVYPFFFINVLISYVSLLFIVLILKAQAIKAIKRKEASTFLFLC